VARKFGWIENPPTKDKGSRKFLVRAEYHGLLRRVAPRSNQGVTTGGKRGTILRMPKHYEGAENPNNFTSTSVQYIYFR